MPINCTFVLKDFVKAIVELFNQGEPNLAQHQLLSSIIVVIHFHSLH